MSDNTSGNIEGSSNAQAPLFSNRDLLTAYSDRLMSWAGHMSLLAQMNRSPFLRDVFAFAATYEQYTADELYALVKSEDTHHIEFRFEWLNQLGQLLAFQDLKDGDSDFAIFCLVKSVDTLPFRSLRKDNYRLQIELMIEVGYFRQADAVLEAAKETLDDDCLHLPVDVSNPYVNLNKTNESQWLSDFNEPFLRRDMSRVYLSSGSGFPFDRLRADPVMEPMPVRNAPLISVIMTSYAPDIAAFETAVRSILTQSWSRLELIIVDDATPGGTPRTVRTIAEQDPRVKLIELTENRGTYHARNVGLKHAGGEFVTGQDSDDWSHPDRLFKQVSILVGDTEASGVVTKAMRTDDNLIRSLRGIDPERLCEVSLMFRADVARRMGGYLESRKGADSEFRMRLELFTGRSVELVDAPYYITRLSKGSLSRSDFRRGWSHQNRRAFSNFIRQWHKAASRAGASLEPSDRLEQSIPIKFQARPGATRSFDYVFLGDWRFDSSTTRFALMEIETLKDSGYSVGVMQLAGVFPGKSHVSRLCETVQTLINERKISLVIPDEGAIINTLLIRSAELMQFAPDDGFRGNVEKIVIVADQAPSSWDGTSALYHPSDCDERVVRLIGQKPLWVAQDPAIRDYLLTYSEGIRVCDAILPVVLPVARHINTRGGGYANSETRLGRTASNIEARWPDSAYEIDAICPAGQNQELRILGEAGCYLRKFETSDYPNNWVSFHPGDISLEAFYASLHYFVYYPSENWPQSLSYDAFLAQAFGCVVILPARFRAMHRGRAQFGNYAEVQAIVRSDHSGSKGAVDNKVFSTAFKHEASRSRAAFIEFLANLERENAKVGV